MTRTPSAVHWTFRAGVAAATFALSLGAAAPAEAQDAPAPPAPIGRLEVSPNPSSLGAFAVRLAGSITGWVRGAAGGGDAADPLQVWAEQAVGMRLEGGSWDLEFSGPGGALALRPTSEAPGEAPLEIGIELNEWRNRSAQPFSRTSRGRVLDALSLDNARRARLALLPASPEEDAPLSAVIFYESRTEKPGRWHAQEVATVSFAPCRGDEPPERPLVMDFGEQWGAFALAMTDLSLALDPADETLSTSERFAELGPERLGRLRGLVSGIEGRVWAWAGHDGPTLAAPLVRGASERTVVGQMQSVFGPRLAWVRESGGRATARLACIQEARAPVESDPQVFLRFIKIADRSILAIAASEADLDAAPALLAKVSH